jgi:hypothetical protein
MYRETASSNVIVPYLLPAAVELYTVFHILADRDLSGVSSIGSQLANYR